MLADWWQLFLKHESTILWVGCIAQFVIGFLAFLMLQCGFPSPYGRNHEKMSKNWGPPIDPRLSWMLQESPAVFAGIICYYLGDEAMTKNPANMVVMGLFLLHYTHRSFIYPWRLNGGKPVRIFVTALAFLYVTANGYMQCRYLTKFVLYPSDWTRDPRFWVGIIVFFLGMGINMHSDTILLNLRPKGEKGYFIPKGGMFKYVSGANFFGEQVEWLGYAIAGWHLPGAAFAFFTFCNLAPRARQHHAHYLELFKDKYPKERTAYIPFLW